MMTNFGSDNGTWKRYGLEIDRNNNKKKGPMSNIFQRLRYAEDNLSMRLVTAIKSIQSK